MAETLFYFGYTTSSPPGSTIWQTTTTGSGSTPVINSDIGVNIGNAISSPDPILLCANGQIYAQAGELLLVWDPQTMDATPFNVPNNGSSVLNPHGFAYYDGASGPRVYFGGEYWSGASTSALISTDGTQSGTTPINGSAVNPSSPVVAFDRLCFLGDNGVYIYDGSSGGRPEQVADIGSPAYLTACAAGTYIGENRPPLAPFPISLFMSGQDSTGTWLYQYDGQHLSPPIIPADAASSGLQPSNLVSLGWQTTNKVGFGPDGTTIYEEVYHFAVFFSGMTAAGHHGLWMSEGANGATTKIVVPAPAAVDLYPFNLTAWNGKLYFTGNVTDGGRGLFVYDPVKNKASEIKISPTLNFDPGFEEDWQGNGFYNQTTMTVFNAQSPFRRLGARGRGHVERRQSMADRRHHQ